MSGKASAQEACITERIPIISNVDAGTIWKWTNRSGSDLYIQALSLSPISSPPTLQLRIAEMPWFCEPPGGTGTGPVGCPENYETLYNAFSYEANYPDEEILLPQNKSIEVDASQSQYGAEVFFMIVRREVK